MKKGYLLEVLLEPVTAEEMALTMLDTGLLLVLAEVLTLVEVVLVVLALLDDEALLDDDDPLFPQPANSNKLIIVATIPKVANDLFFIFDPPNKK